jgi:hypothetical protein
MKEGRDSNIYFHFQLSSLHTHDRLMSMDSRSLVKMHIKIEKNRIPKELLK